MSDAVRVTIDSAGRLVVPKKLRDSAGLEAGMPLVIRFHDGRLEIEPEPRKVRLEREGRLLIAVPEEPGEPMSQQSVEDTLREIRGRHDL